VELRTERPDDRDAVREIHLQAFGAQGKAVADLVDTLRTSLRPGSGTSLIAEEESQLVGHVMFTRALLDAPRRLVEVQVLSPLAVLPAYQRKGIGAALVRAGLRTMTTHGASLVFLEGSPHYYRRFGFTPGAELGFRKPSLRIPDAAFQVVRLPAYQPWMTGTLVYPQAFWDHDVVGLREESA
jgi:putative acetyltransferase